MSDRREEHTQKLTRIQQSGKSRRTKKKRTKKRGGERNRGEISLRATKKKAVPTTIEA